MTGESEGEKGSEGERERERGSHYQTRTMEKVELRAASNVDRDVP